MGQEGCRVYHCCGYTMVSKLKLDHNEVPRAFVQKYRRSVLPKSLRTHPDHTPCRFKFTLRSLTKVTVLHFVLRLSFYQTHDFFKNVFSLSSGNGFSVLLSFLHTKSYKTPLFREENEKLPPDPLPSSDATQTPTSATPL